MSDSVERCRFLFEPRKVMTEKKIKRLKAFVEDEARSCSMDFGCVTPLYVYRMWGGKVALEDIESALIIAREQL